MLDSSIYSSDSTISLPVLYRHIVRVGFHRVHKRLITFKGCTCRTVGGVNNSKNHQKIQLSGDDQGGTIRLGPEAVAVLHITVDDAPGPFKGCVRLYDH